MRRLLSSLAPRAGASAWRVAAPAALVRSLVPRTVKPPLFASSRRWLAASGETVEVPVPAMGDSITEGTVLSLAKKVGDHVALEEVFGVAQKLISGNWSGHQNFVW